MTKALDVLADAQLIAAVRQGDVAAFGILYERHLASAKRAASYLARTHAEREDLVAEAFTRVLRILRDGRGPAEEFRPYLLVTLRNIAIHSATRGVPVSLYADLPDAYVTDDRGDPVIDRWNASVAATAFASLPERWRVVLWHTEVEKESPAEVATLLGMRPNSVAALAYRAREGLRQAYLRMHVVQPPRPECAQTVKKLAAYVRRNLPLPLSDKIGRHLTGCADCRARLDVLTSINAEIASLLAPVVLGAPLAAAYLQGSSAAVTTTTAAVTASAADTCLVAGALAVKTTALKAGAAVLAAVTAVTTAAAGSSAVPPAQPEQGKVVDGERGSTVTVTGPPLRTVSPRQGEPSIDGRAKGDAGQNPDKPKKPGEGRANPGQARNVNPGRPDAPPAVLPVPPQRKFDPPRDRRNPDYGNKPDGNSDRGNKGHQSAHNDHDRTSTGNWKPRDSPRDEWTRRWSWDTGW